MYQNYYNRNRDERFVVPFLVGALAGGAAVGVTRPRPVVVNPNPYYRPYPYSYYPYPNYYYNYGYGYKTF
jgi:hypothetical protein